MLCQDDITRLKTRNTDRLEFSLNYAKFAAFLKKRAYMENSTINSAKKLPPVGIEPRTS